MLHLFTTDPMLVSTPVRSGDVGEKNEGATESNLYSYAGFTFRFRRLYCAIYRAKGGSHVVGFSNSVNGLSLTFEDQLLSYKRITIHRKRLGCKRENYKYSYSYKKKKYIMLVNFFNVISNICKNIRI